MQVQFRIIEKYKKNKRYKNKGRGEKRREEEGRKVRFIYNLPFKSENLGGGKRRIDPKKKKRGLNYNIIAY